MKNLFLALFLVVANLAIAQNIILDDNNQEVFNCGSVGSLVNPGGASYGQNVQFVKTICTNGDPFSVELIAASFGSTGDFICVYDGIGATAPLITCFTSSNLPPPGFQIRSSINNASGCLTFQFVSDNVTSGGSFEFAMNCLPACKFVEAVVASTFPATEASNGIYINSCPGDSVVLFGEGSYDPNLAVYTQSDATSNFYWNFGDGTFDTTQNPIHYFPDGQIFVITLQVEDVNGCRSANEINLRVRQAVSVDLQFDPITDLICLGDSTEFTGYIEGIVIGDSTYLDTITGQNAASVVDTVFLPDDSNGISGDGITTPVVYPLEIYGYIPGTLLVDTNDLYSICLDIEHSFVGDLDIRLVCPNGQFTTLVDFTPPGTPGNSLGIPNFTTAPGTPFTYCWSPSSVIGSIDVGQPSLANDPVLAGTYEATGEWSDLIGCPLNGEWTIQIFDDYGADDGNTFAASIEFNPFYLLAPDTFLVYYVNPLWDSNPEILSSLNDTTVSVIAADTIPNWFYFNVENNMGCTFRDSVFLDVDYFEVTAIPADTAICYDTIPLNVILEGVPLQCEATYTVSSVPVSTIAASSPTNISLSDDALSTTINMPFDFDFFCDPKASFQISSNGFISFTPAGNGCCSGQNLPNPNTPNDLIALFWSDLNPSNGGQIRHWTTGVAPNRIKVVEFTNVPHFGSGANTVTGQIQMFESSNFIEVHCVNCMSDGGTITLGIENVDGSVAYAAPGHNGTATAAVNEAWRFTPANSLGNYGFSWGPNSNISATNIQNPNVWPSASTNYVVEVTNANNCVARDTAFINLTSAFEPIVSNDTTLCLGESAQLSVLGGQTYVWSPNNSTINDVNIANPTVSPTASTTYYVVADSSGCSAIDSVQVFVIDNSVQLENADTTICSGESVQLQVLGSSIAVWSPNDGSLSSIISPNPVASPTATTTYNVLMGPAACAISDQVTITVLPTSGTLLAADSEICEGETINLEASGASSYSWSPNNGTLSSTNTAITVASPTVTTTYYVLFNAGQCETLDSVNIVVNLNPDIVINNGQASYTICSGENLDLQTTSFANGQYSWQDEFGVELSTSNSFTASNAGTYTVFVIDNNSCPGDATVDLIVRDAPEMDFTDLRTILCCTEDEVTLNPLDYLLNPVNISEVLVNGSASSGPITEQSGMNTSYVIELITDEGCSSIDTVNFQTNCINPEIIAEDSVFLGTSTPVTVLYNANGVVADITWLDANLFEDNSLESTNLLANLAAEFYNYSVSVSETFVLNNPDSSLTCIEFAEAIIYTINVGDPLLPDAFSPNGDNINQRFFPINLDFNSNLASLRVFNRWGELVYDYQDGDLGWDGTFEGNDQAADVYSYYIKIEKPSGEFIQSGTLTLIR